VKYVVQIKKILVPLDGSKNSMRGLDEAIYLARQCGATITGIHCLTLSPHSEFSGRPSAEKSLIKEVRKFMDDAKLKAAQNGVVFTSKIVNGDIGYNIIKTAQNEKVDLIIIGSRGHGSLQRLFLGSVSNYVVHSAKVPLLIVK
jgi:nucleotide-binding universal stress UspA family protein